MKRTTLALAILFSLAGTTAVQAETPMVTVQPLELEVVPATAEAAAQEVVEAVTDTAAAVQAQPAAEPAAAQAAAAEEAPAVELPAEAPAAGPEAVVEAPAEAAAAEESAAAEVTTAADAESAAAVEAAPETDETIMPGRPPCPRPGMGMMGKGPCKDGMKPGCDHRGKGKMGMMAKHEEIVQRLDMIEARMAKIEAMLESLMKRGQDE